MMKHSTLREDDDAPPTRSFLEGDIAGIAKWMTPRRQDPARPIGVSGEGGVFGDG
jgi:hypothetical protein